MIARHDQTGDMGNVCHEISIHAFGDLAHSGKINGARISGSATNDEFGAHLFSQLSNFFIVQQARFGVDTVLMCFVQLTSKTLRIGMAQVPTIV